MKLSDIVDVFTPRTYLYMGICLLSLLIAYLIIKFGIVIGLMFSITPIALYFVFYSIKNPYWAFTSLFIINYLIVGMFRYMPALPMGIIIDALIAFSFAILLVRTCYKTVQWSRAFNGLTLSSFIWLIYCGFEIFNPNAVLMGWGKAIRSLAVYSFCIVILTPIIFSRYKDLKRILFILSLLTLFAVLKAVIQKVFGFDYFEQQWLYTDGGMKTHLLRTGTRYFSIYTDAANFGSGMGLAMVIFSIYALYCKQRLTQFYFLFIAAAAGYGLLISGTRSALAVPFAGYTIYILICKIPRVTITGFVLLVSIFAFMKFTNIGGSVSEIRRMRSAFNVNDASFQVRLKNQEKLAVILKDKPFGMGVGMGGGKAFEYAPNSPVSRIPTDSWFVLMWVETGIVGLFINISILIYILIYGCYVVLFKLKDPQLRGTVTALIAGMFGIMTASYANEIYGQFPTAIIIYMSQAFVFMSPFYDKEITERREEEQHEYEEIS